MRNLRMRNLRMRNLRMRDLRTKDLRMRALRIRVFVQDKFLVFNVGFDRLHRFSVLIKLYYTVRGIACSYVGQGGEKRKQELVSGI